jgi:uncharacterized protein
MWKMRSAGFIGPEAAATGRRWAVYRFGREATAVRSVMANELSTPVANVGLTRAGGSARVSRRVLLGLFAVGVAAAGLPGAPARAQRSIDQDEITIVTATGHHVVAVDLIKDPAKISRLKPYRRIARDEGLLFSYPVLQPIAVSTEGIPFPSDLLFIAADGKIVAIHVGLMPNVASFTAMVPVRAALLLLAGTVGRFGIVAGDHVLSAMFGRTI